MPVPEGAPWSGRYRPWLVPEVQSALGDADWYVGGIDNRRLFRIEIW